jgi:dienelactone hydrolase
VSEIVLFHSALGLRPAVRGFADELRVAGHMVHTPDLFDGEVFEDLADGIKKRDALGIPELMRRAKEAVADLPGGISYAGFSMGAGAAEYLAATRAGAKSAILMQGVFAPEQAGITSWPRGVPVQVHYARDDSSMDLKAVESLSALVRNSGAHIGVYAYASGGHLFADEGTRDYDRAASWLMLERVLELVARVDLADRITEDRATTPRQRPRPEGEGFAS